MHLLAAIVNSDDSSTRGWAPAELVAVDSVLSRRPPLEVLTVEPPPICRALDLLKDPAVCLACIGEELPFTKVDLVGKWANIKGHCLYLASSSSAVARPIPVEAPVMTTR